MSSPTRVQLSRPPQLAPVAKGSQGTPGRYSAHSQPKAGPLDLVPDPKDPQIDHNGVECIAWCEVSLNTASRSQS